MFYSKHRNIDFCPSVDQMLMLSFGTPCVEFLSLDIREHVVFKYIPGFLVERYTMHHILLCFHVFTRIYEDFLNGRKKLK